MKTHLVNLKGGAKLLFNKQTEVNGISVVFSFDAGAINDPVDKLGTAHFLEHAIYNFPNAKMNRQERFDYSRRFQYSNAFTSVFEMAFLVNTIDKKLEETFDYITEPFSSIKFSKKEFEAEQKVIRDEISTRQKANRTLMHRIYCNEILNDERMKRMIESPAGSLETFNNIKLNDLKTFKKKYLTLNNLTIIVVGNTSLNKLKRLVKKYVESRIDVSDFEGYKLKNPDFSTPSFHFRKADEKDKAVFNVIYLLKKLPFRFEKYEEEIKSLFLSQVLNEITFNYFRLNKKLCYSCNSLIYKSNDYFQHEINIPCSEENLQSVIDAYGEFLETLPENLPEDSFNKFKERYLDSYNYDFMNLSNYNNMCIQVYKKENKLYSNKYKNNFRKNLEKVTYKDANEIYKTLFKVNPHISIISNDEKYKDYNYQDFCVTKK